ncbi:MAG: sulfurtransferase TusA family protein [Cyanobacteria bacterium]|nr:sulfurtransferase TusA family protein [Cyanobacteriota bacterium]
MSNEKTTPMQNNRMPFLDLRQSKCPLNFVQTKLALEKLPEGGQLEVWIQLGGESALNIPKSLSQEGHLVLRQERDEPAGYERLWIQKGRATENSVVEER